MNDGVVFLLTMFIVSLGSVVYCLIKNRFEKSILVTLGYGYGLGVGAIAMQLYLYSRIHVSWNPVSLALPWIILIVVFCYIHKNVFKRPRLKLLPLPFLGKILILSIILVVLYVCFESVLRPVSVWDSWAIWLARAKIFFIDGQIRPATLNYEHTDYPLVISLLGTFVYIFLGKVDDTAVLFVFFAFYLFLAILFYSRLRQRFGVVYSLLFTFLLLTLQTLIRQGGRLEAGQADLAVGYYSFIDFTLCMEYIKQRNIRILLLLSLYLGITCLIKFDGIPLACVMSLFIIVLILKQKLYKHLLFFSIWVIPPIDWQIYKMIHHVHYSYISAHPIFFSWNKTKSVVQGEFQELINIKSWNMLWIVYLYSFFVIRLKKDAELSLLHILIISQILIYTLLYIFTAGNDPSSSMERLLVHIAPLALYAIALVLHHFKNLYATIKL